MLPGFLFHWKKKLLLTCEGIFTSNFSRIHSSPKNIQQCFKKVDSFASEETIKLQSHAFLIGTTERQWNGFWILRKSTEFNFKQAKIKFKIVLNRFLDFSKRKERKGRKLGPKTLLIDEISFGKHLKNHIASKVMRKNEFAAFVCPSRYSWSKNRSLGLKICLKILKNSLKFV